MRNFFGKITHHLELENGEEVCWEREFHILFFSIIYLAIEIKILVLDLIMTSNVNLYAT